MRNLTLALRQPISPQRGAPPRWLIRLFAVLAAPWVRSADTAALDSLPEPAIYAFNHSNTFECCVLPPLLLLARRGRPLHFLVDWVVLQRPVLGWLVGQSQPIAVFSKPDRLRRWSTVRRAAAGEPAWSAALRYLDGGESVALFPEGKRNPTSRRLLPARAGLSRLVLASSVPVVPMGIRWRSGPAAPAIGRLDLVVGEPLDFAAERAGYEGLAPVAGGRSGKPERELRRQIDHAVMSRIAELAGKLPPLTKVERAGGRLPVPVAGGGHDAQPGDHHL